MNNALRNDAKPSRASRPRGYGKDADDAEEGDVGSAPLYSGSRGSVDRL